MKQEQTETFESFYNKINVNVYPPSTSNSIKYKLERLKQLHEQEIYEYRKCRNGLVNDLNDKDKEIEKFKQDIQKLIKENNDLIDGCNNWIKGVLEKDKEIEELKQQFDENGK